MSSRWSRVEELFHGALERAPAEREAYLREACGGDEELRREVQSLLAEERSAERMMERPAASAAWNSSSPLDQRLDMA
jgi:serine/threonine-protein kinase